MSAKVCFVTGSGRRIGASIIRKFANEGYAVLIHVSTSVEEGELLNTEVEFDSLFDSYLGLLRVSESADGSAEVRITMEYVDDELIWSALLASLPSFIIFGIVVEGYVNRSKQIESDDISNIDSR